MKEEMWGEEHFLVRYEMWLPTVKFGTQKSLASKPSHWPVTSKPSYWPVIEPAYYINPFSLSFPFCSSLCNTQYYLDSQIKQLDFEQILLSSLG
jgi:hypothetical protein